LPFDFPHLILWDTESKVTSDDPLFPVGPPSTSCFSKVRSVPPLFCTTPLRRDFPSRCVEISDRTQICRRDHVPRTARSLVSVRRRLPAPDLYLIVLRTAVAFSLPYGLTFKLRGLSFPFMPGNTPTFFLRSFSRLFLLWLQGGGNRRVFSRFFRALIFWKVTSGFITFLFLFRFFTRRYGVFQTAHKNVVSPSEPTDIRANFQNIRFFARATD